MRRALSVLVLMAACGGRAAAPSVKDAPGGEAVREAKVVVAEILRAVRSGDSDDVLSLATDDLLVMGPRAQDAYGSRTDAVLALREHIDPKRKPRLTTAGAALTAGPGGRSAFLVDRLQLGRRPLLATGLLDGHDGIWRLLALQLSHPVSAAEAKKAAGKQTLSGPGLGKPAPDRSAPGAKDAADAEDALRRALAQPAQLAAALERADGTWLTADGAVISGPRKLAQAGKRLAELRYQVTTDPMSVVTGDDALAYVTCAATRQAPKGEPQALRVGAVFRRSAAGWDLVVLHEAQALGKAP